jgi:hypothetical protein
MLAVITQFLQEKLDLLLKVLEQVAVELVAVL